MAASSVDLPTSFQRHLRAENKSVRTVETYLEAAQQLDAFLRTRGIDLAAADRDDIEAYLAGLLARWKAATAANGYRALRVFYAWLEDEGETPSDPMAKMKPPRIPDQAAPVPTEELRRRLLATCAGRDFEARRDHTLDPAAPRHRRPTRGDRGHAPGRCGLRVRRGAGGRQGRPRAGPAVRQPDRQGIDQYLRARARHAHADLEWFWIGRKGRVAASGIAQLLRRRSREAGIENLHAHLLRHTFAHLWLSQGGGETDLMRLAGWTSRAMLQRYGASVAVERAREALGAFRQQTGWS
jgi:site-specific recombinase XerD